MNLQQLANTKIFISDLDDAKFTCEQKKVCIGKGIDLADNWVKLWAYWYSSMGRVDNDFIDERFHDYCDLTEEQKNFLLKKVHEVDDFFNQFN